MEGKWLLVRSDRHVVTVERAHVPYVLGRRRDLPEAQQLQATYASREHLVVTWRPPHLHVVQRGRNPTFYSDACYAVPRANNNNNNEEEEADDGGLVFVADAQGQAAHVVLADADVATTDTAREDVARTRHRVCVAPTDALHITTPPSRATVEANTLYFPEEAGLPTLSVRLAATATAPRAGESAATTSLSVQQMLTVPTLSSDDTEDGKDDGEGGNAVLAVKATTSTAAAAQGGCGSDVLVRAVVDDTPRHDAAAATTSPMARWRGLLDDAMQQQQLREQQAKHEQETRTEKATSTATRKTTEGVAAHGRGRASATRARGGRGGVATTTTTTATPSRSTASRGGRGGGGAAATRRGKRARTPPSSPSSSSSSSQSDSDSSSSGSDRSSSSSGGSSDES